MFTILLFICVAATLGLVVAAFTMGEEKPVSIAARLKAATGQGAGPVSIRDAEEMDKSIVTRLILPLSQKLSKNFSGITPATMVSQCNKLIMEAGMSGKITGAQLTTICWVLAIVLVGLVLLLGSGFVAQGRFGWGQVLGVAGLAAALGYRLPIGIITSKAQQRKHEIQKALPFTFDLISISVEAGMAFDGAMATVAERTSGPLSDELKLTLREINLGISRYDALNNLGQRVGVEDLKTFLTAVNYISKLGGSLVDVIRIQTEAMRIKRRQAAEKLAAQAPVKIMIPLVLFIFPCIFIVILGPAMIRVVTGQL